MIVTRRALGHSPGRHPLSPSRRWRLQFPVVLLKNRELWWRLTEREVLGRYRGSHLGWTWSFLQPLLMLVVYTFVFSQVFQSRWGTLQNQGSLAFAVNLFAGLIVFNLFAECANRAPGLVLSHPNYVKKVVFPLEILASVALGSAAFHALASLIILLVFELVAFQAIPASILWLPVIWIPLLLGCLGITWLLSSLGVFLRDIGQVVQVVVSMLMFLSPVFFPMSAMPPRWQPLLQLNPLAQVIEQTRRVAIQGEAPELGYVVVGLLLGVVIAELGLRLFQKAQGAFADVM